MMHFGLWRISKRDWTEIRQVLDRVDHNLQKLMEINMTAMDDAVSAMTTQAQGNTDVENSAAQTLGQLSDIIRRNANNPQQLLDLAAKLKAGQDALAAAIAATADVNQ